MCTTNIREILISVTTELVRQNAIFTSDERQQFLKVFVKSPDDLATSSNLPTVPSAATKRSTSAVDAQPIQGNETNQAGVSTRDGCGRIEGQARAGLGLRAIITNREQDENVSENLPRGKSSDDAGDESSDDHADDESNRTSFDGTPVKVVPPPEATRVHPDVTANWKRIVDSGLEKKFDSVTRDSGIRPAASRDVSCFEPICKLAGKVIPPVSGCRQYRSWGDGNYCGLLIFNMGFLGGYNWHSAIGIHESLQLYLLTNQTEPNAALTIVELKKKPIPLIFATQAIKKGQPILVSRDSIRSLNKSFFDKYGKMETPNKPRNCNPQAYLDSKYIEGLLSGSCGLEIYYINDVWGNGVRAIKKFEKDDFLTEYCGEVISNNEGRKRFRKYPKSLGSYLFILGPGFNNMWIDATQIKTGFGRYVNHSKNDFNCKTKCIWANGTPKLFLVATKTIEVGDQLLYDYYDRNKNFGFLSK